MESIFLRMLTSFIVLFVYVQGIWTASDIYKEGESKFQKIAGSVAYLFLVSVMVGWLLFRVWTIKWS